MSTTFVPTINPIRNAIQVLVEWDERNRFAQFLPLKKAHLTLTHYDLSSLQLLSRFKKICFTSVTNENITLLISESLLAPQPLPLLQRLHRPPPQNSSTL